MTTPVVWNQVQDCIKAVVTFLAGVAPGAVVWADEQRPAGSPMILLDLLYLDSIQDRESVDVTTTPSVPIWSLSSLYYIRVQVRAESVFNAPGADALFALERARAGLQRPDLPLTAGVIVQPDSDTYVHHVSYPVDGRMLSSYSFETGFRAVLDYPTTTPNPVVCPPPMVEVDYTGTADDGRPPSPQTISRAVLRPA